eukprot:Selendium_serpulae@DN2543_c0_g1_i1.p1
MSLTLLRSSRRCVGLSAIGGRVSPLSSPRLQCTPAHVSECRRAASSVKFVEEMDRASEAQYFRKQVALCFTDEVLIARLLEKNPELSAGLGGSEAWDEATGLLEAIDRVCLKHGLQPASSAFAKDIVAVMSDHGWSDIETRRKEDRER